MKEMVMNEFAYHDAGFICLECYETFNEPL